MQDLKEASSALIKALTIREKYMAMALQSYPRTTARFLQPAENRESFANLLDTCPDQEKKTIEGKD